MVKKVKKSIGKSPVKIEAKIVSKKTEKHSKPNISIVDGYKKGLLEIDKQQDKYDRLFEQKLAEQYREFRNLKEHRMQSKRFLRIIIVLITIVLIALLILSYG